MQLIQVEKRVVAPDGRTDWAETAQAYSPYAAIIVKAPGIYRVQVESVLTNVKGESIVSQRTFELAPNEQAIIDEGGIMVLQSPAAAKEG